MLKKSQSISINTIIIAAIALGVLVVLFVIFTGRIGSFSKGLSETASCENSCKALGKSRGEASNKQVCSDGGGTYIPGSYTDLQNKEYVCCCNFITLNPNIYIQNI